MRNARGVVSFRLIATNATSSPVTVPDPKKGIENASRTYS